MIIAIAGSIGAGKSTVAKAVSRRLGIPFHEIDEDKRVVGRSYPEFPRWVAESTPFPDDFRRAVFARALEQLVALGRHHAHAIVEETFHRAAIREPFFASAAEAMGGIVIIEIAVDRDVALAHLAKRAQSDQNHLAGPAMYDAFQAIADPLEAVDLTVANNGDLDETVAKVCRFIEARLADQDMTS
jgi:dephospho-CoA kinase